MTDLFSQLIGEQSARWHAQFVDNLPVGVFRTTVEGRFVFCNKTLARLLGYGSVKELAEIPVVDLYRNSKERGELVQQIIKYGNVDRFKVELIKKDNNPVPCVLTARAVMDDDGMVVFLDGIIREISPDQDQKLESKISGPLKDFFVLLDLKGDREPDGAPTAHGRTGHDPANRDSWIGKPLMEFIEPGYRDLFALFLADVIEHGHKEGMIALVDKDGIQRRINYQACVAKTAQSIDEKLSSPQKDDNYGNPAGGQEKMNQEKLEGIMEMAGGISHRLNQPLTIINNILSEILSDYTDDRDSYKKIVKVQEQVFKLNEMVRKIANIRKYEAMDYVAGIKIVDIDKAI